MIWILTEELVRRGHEVTLFASGDSRTTARLVPTIDRALWHNERYSDDLPFVTLAIDEVYRRADEFDIIHNHDQLPALALARAHPEIPTLTTLHGRLDLPECQPLFAHFAEQPLSSISMAQRAPLPRANWVGMVHHGLPLDALPFQPRSQGYLAFVGRVARDKGLDSAIRVARRAGLPLRIAARMPLNQPANPDAQRDWRYYEEVVKPLLAEPGVDYVGELGDEEKAALMSGAAAFLFPIRWPEPFGLVMIEALAGGTPVIALRRGSTPEVIEDGVTGFLADDEDGLVQAVEHLEELDRAQCRAAVEARFSAEVMAAGYERIYRLLSGMGCAGSIGAAAARAASPVREGAQSMAEKPLDGMRVAILCATDFEQSEMTEPRQALEEAGAETILVSPKGGQINGMKHDEKADTFKVDMTLGDANPNHFDALMLPGGALNADALRVVPEAQAFVREFQGKHKPMAVICHAPWLLASAGLARGRKLTSYHTIQDDLRNAGAEWVDRDVVVDDNLVTSRQPTDIPVFNREMIALFTRQRALTGQRPLAETVQEYVGAEDLQHERG